MEELKPTVLILGGTREARKLAEKIVGSKNAANKTTGKWNVVLSLAGRTKKPIFTSIETRIGGFSDAKKSSFEGMCDYISSKKISVILDATHPFATKISKTAGRAASETGIPIITLLRPPWDATEQDNWISVKSELEAAKNIPPLATVFLALGSQYLSMFSNVEQTRFVIRMVDKPTSILPIKNYKLILDLPSTSKEKEYKFLLNENITHIICRNSGGMGAFAKIEAARTLNIPVIMIERPQKPTHETFATIQTVLTKLDAIF